MSSTTELLPPSVSKPNPSGATPTLEASSSYFDYLTIENIQSVALPIISLAVGAYFSYQYYQLELIKDFVIGTLGISYGVSGLCLSTVDPKNLQETTYTTMALAAGVFSLVAASGFALSAVTSFEAIKLVAFIGHTCIFGNTFSTLHPLIQQNSSKHKVVDRKPARIAQFKADSGCRTEASPERTAAESSSSRAASSTKDPSVVAHKSALTGAVSRSALAAVKSKAPEGKPSEAKKTPTLTFHKPSKPKGFINLGNTCFMNACLKMMISNPEFRTRIALKPNLNLEPGEQAPRLAYRSAILAHMKTLIAEFQKPDAEIDHQSVGNALYGIRRNPLVLARFRQGTTTQEDAHEFFTLIADYLEIGREPSLCLGLTSTLSNSDIGIDVPTNDPLQGCIELGSPPPTPKIPVVKLKKVSMIQLPKAEAKPSILSFFAAPAKSLLDKKLKKKPDETDEDFAIREDLRKKLLGKEKIALEELKLLKGLERVEESDVLVELSKVLEIGVEKFKISKEERLSSDFSKTLKLREEESEESLQARKAFQKLFATHRGNLEKLRASPLLEASSEETIMQDIADALEINLDKLEIRYVDGDESAVNVSVQEMLDGYLASEDIEDKESYILNRFFIADEVITKELAQQDGETEIDFQKRKTIQKILRDKQIVPENIRAVREQFGQDVENSAQAYEKVCQKNSSGVSEIDILALRSFLGLEAINQARTVLWLKGLLEVEPESPAVVVRPGDARPMAGFTGSTYKPDLKKTLSFYHPNLAQLRSIPVRLPRFKFLGGYPRKYHFMCLGALDQLETQIFDQTTNRCKTVHLTPKSFVVHSGNTSGGHYISYVKEGENWFLHNDGSVSPVDLSVFESSGFLQGVYLINYETAVVEPAELAPMPEEGAGALAGEE